MGLPTIYRAFFLGMQQRKDRNVPIAMAFLFPVLMFLYSAYESTNLIQLRLQSITLWTVGFAVAWFVNDRFFLSKEISYSKITGKFFIPGSIIPFILIMAIFTSKYIQGAIQALYPDTLKTTAYISAYTLLNGVFCSVFLSRILHYLKTIRRYMSEEFDIVDNEA